MRISDWSSDVCSSDLVGFRLAGEADLGEDGDAEAERLGIEVGMIDVGHPPIILQIPEDSAVDEVQLDPPHESFSIFRRVCAISEERRVGKEGSTFRFRWAPVHEKKKRRTQKTN